MSKEIKNQILEAASKKGSPEQRINYDLLQYALEMNEEGVISMLQVDIDDVKSLQVFLTDKGSELLKSGGYK